MSEASVVVLTTLQRIGSVARRRGQASRNQTVTLAAEWRSPSEEAASAALETALIVATESPELLRLS
jgi:hypothetical protein